MVYYLFNSSYTNFWSYINNVLTYDMKKFLIILFLVCACQKNERKVYPPDSLGLWTIKYFVNEFKEPTDVGYITNIEPIKGEFINLQADGEKLNIKLMIKEDAIAFKLYEYEREDPVKGNRQNPIEYDITIQHNGIDIDFIFKAYNETDVAIVGNVISSEHQKKLIGYLKMGGLLKFNVKEKNNNRTLYTFSIINEPIYAFENAINKLIK